MTRTVLNRSRASQARGPLAWLADRLVPSEALSWGRLTVERPRWRSAMAECEWRVVLRDRDGARQAFERLAATMGEAGKVTPDATSPAVFNPRLQP